MQENDSALLNRLVIKRQRNGRCRYDRQAKRELVEACLQPGVSVARLAYQHAVNANLLRKWIVQYQRERDHALTTVKPEPAMAAAFVPVVQIKTPIHASPSQLHVRLPNGIAIDLSNAASDELSLFLRMLCELPCSASTKG